MEINLIAQSNRFSWLKRRHLAIVVLCLLLYIVVSGIFRSTTDKHNKVAFDNSQSQITEESLQQLYYQSLLDDKDKLEKEIKSAKSDSDGKSMRKLIMHLFYITVAIMVLKMVLRHISHPLGGNAQFQQNRREK